MANFKTLITEKVSRELAKQIDQKFNNVWFTSDMHFTDDRLNLFGRDLLFKNSDEVDDYIINKWNEKIRENDLTIVVGDVALSKKGLEKMKLLNGTKWLVKGNYDEKEETAKFDISDELLKKYFQAVVSELYLKIGNEIVYINHYPTNAKKEYFNIVGHIHGLFKVQRNMINVGVDAWHFCPVSKKMIEFQMNGIKKYYDQNVFAGELTANISKKENQITILRAPEQPLTTCMDDFTIFLAGPIQGADNWQEKLIKLLEKQLSEKNIKKNIVIASPRRTEFIKTNFDYSEQVDWESMFLNRASDNGIVVFWLPKEKNKEENKGRSYAQTTRFEIGEFYNKANNIIIGGSLQFDGIRYIKYKLSKNKKEFQFYTNLSDAANSIIELIIKK